jgi:hypothetical protein
MRCPKCNSINVNVNGLFYHCLDCGELDDSTWAMLIEDSKRNE